MTQSTLNAGRTILDKIAYEQKAYALLSSEIAKLKLELVRRKELEEKQRTNDIRVLQSLSDYIDEIFVEKQ